MNGPVLRARVGDLLIVESITRGRAGRTGLVVALYHTDGSPPYLVRWLGEGCETPCYYPGPDARVERRWERLPESP
ncbi:DUF1918 domain-containing protein [Microbispora sp. H11081]|uniref:DUF1918 domain-containing protein n=1 Tax=Microbispora sp. H11081 TaxID=2729107 RepID=UPI0020166F71|nr:DUF1918 domain-containing protein [Microbispora sp. H11081]